MPFLALHPPLGGCLLPKINIMSESEASATNDEYQRYVEHQKEKTNDPVRREKWLGEEWDQKLHGFKRVFANYAHLFKACEKGLCLGARTGQEVVALNEMGIESIGVDLVACQPYVVEGDIHDLQFDDQSFDLVFTNIFDHALYPDKFCAEISRVLRPGGYVLMNFQIDTHQDKYTVTELGSVREEILPHFPGFEILVNLPIPQNVHAMNWELLLQKT